MDRNDLVSNQLKFAFCLLIGLLANSMLVAQSSVSQQFRPPFESSPTLQRGSRVVYNPVTKLTEARHQTTRTKTLNQPAISQVRQASLAEQPLHELIEEVGYEVPGCGVEAGCGVECGSICEPTCGCGGDCVDGCCGLVSNCSGRPSGAGFYAAFEATFLKPHFDNNIGYTTTESDGATFETITDTEFSYDTGFSPRVYFGWKHQDGVGMRFTWWDFDEEADPLTSNPPANGFGSITHPAFGGVDISSTIPTDAFSASTSLSTHTIDIEGTKETSFCGWDFGVAGGVRYVELDQTYNAQLSDNTDTLLGEIDYSHSLEGFGPTISISASRPLSQRLDLFCKARGSILYGDSESTLTAGEDLDLTTPFTTNQTTNREDLLSIGEIQVGLNWQGINRRNRMRTPFFSVALESQIWNGVGNATSEEGSIGFFGLNTSVGFDW